MLDRYVAVLLTCLSRLAGATEKYVWNPNKLIAISWTPTENDVTFLVEGRTRGYVGLGFAPAPRMEGGDFLIAWQTDAGKKVYADMHVPGFTVTRPKRHAGHTHSLRKTPIKDPLQNYELLQLVQNDSHTVVRFKRSWNTCDANDYNLEYRSVYVLWALHGKDPKSISRKNLMHHNLRGLKKIRYLSGGPQDDMPSGPMVSTWNAVNQKIVPRANASSLCTFHMFHGVNYPYFIIGHEPLGLDVDNGTNLLGMVLYECAAAGKDRYLKMKDLVDTRKAVECYRRSEMEEAMYSCNRPVAVYNKGSDKEVYHESMGVPIGTKSGGSIYFMLEVQYENKTPGVDEYGFRIHYTKRTRANVGAILKVGVTPHHMHIVYPGTMSSVSSLCTSECTEMGFRHNTITVVAVHLHAQGSTVGITLRHVRGSQELPIIMRETNYDLEDQGLLYLRKPVVIKAGDALMLDCDHAPFGHDRIGFGGYGKDREQCLAYIHYYPKTDLVECTSRPTAVSVAKLTGNKVINIQSYDHVKKRARSPSEMNEPDLIYTPDWFKNMSVPSKNKTFFEILQEKKARDPIFATRLLEAMWDGPFRVTCVGFRKTEELIRLPWQGVRIPPFDDFLSKHLTQQCSLSAVPGTSIAAYFTIVVLYNIFFVP